jgi:esterase
MKLFFRKFGSGTPLIILHGLYGSGDNWFTIGKRLAAMFEIYLVDLRNHGNSPHSKIHSYQSMQEDLYELYNSNNIEKAILMGHSMGGKTAMLFSFLHPEKVEKLIIIDIAPKAYKNLSEYNSLAIEHLNILQAFKSVDFQVPQSRKQIEKAFLKFLPDPAASGFLLKNLRRINENEFKWIINLEAISNFLPEILDGLDIKKIVYDKSLVNFPTLFIKGENSVFIMEEDETMIRDIFSNVEFVTIFNAGHMLHIEQPQLLFESLKYFLEK